MFGIILEKLNGIEARPYWVSVIPMAAPTAMRPASEPTVEFADVPSFPDLKAEPSEARELEGSSAPAVSASPVEVPQIQSAIYKAQTEVPPSIERTVEVPQIQTVSPSTLTVERPVEVSLFIERSVEVPQIQTVSVRAEAHDCAEACVRAEACVPADASVRADACVHREASDLPEACVRADAYVRAEACVHDDASSDASSDPKTPPPPFLRVQGGF